MLLAAQAHNWARFSELESFWMSILKKATKEHGAELNTLGKALIEDNQKIQSLIENEQKQLLEALEQSNKNTSSIKSYLK